MILIDDYLQGRDVAYPITDDQRANAIELVERLNELEKSYGKRLIITSGYRPAEINKLIPGAFPHDAHERCCGVDLHDPSLELSDFCINNIHLLEELGLWMESPQSAHDHCHLQSYSPRSGSRVFIA